MSRAVESFPESLHPLSMLDAVRASALRIPDRVAVFDNDCKLSYRDLFGVLADGKAASHPSEFVRWLAPMLAEPFTDENRRAAVVRDEHGPRVLSHRELMLEAMDLIVQHPVFDRDGCMGLSVPLESRLGAVAATISLMLGSSAFLLRSQSLGDVASAIERGDIQTWFLGPSQYADLANALAGHLPGPSPTFQRAFCEGKPPQDVYVGLIGWLRPERVSMQP